MSAEVVVLPVIRIERAVEPRVTPAEAISLALQLSLEKQIGPHSTAVKSVLKALAIAGWKIVPSGNRA